MYEEKFVDYEEKCRQLTERLDILKQNLNGLKENYDYVSSLMNRYFDEKIILEKENEKLKQSFKMRCNPYKKEIERLKLQNKNLLDSTAKLREDNKEIQDLLNIANKLILNKCSNELQEEWVKNFVFEVEICECCKHIHYYNWLDPATMEIEYDSKCLKGHKREEEVLKCNDFEKG